MPASGTTTGWSRVPDRADGGVDSGLNQGGGERQAGVLRSCVAAVGQAWPGRVFHPVAQPQRQLEGIQHEHGALLNGGGSADDGPRIDLHDGHGLDDCGSARPTPEVGHRAEVGRVPNKIASRQARRPLPTLARHGRAPGQLQRNGPTMARRLAVGRLRQSCIPYAAILLVYAYGIEMSISAYRGTAARSATAPAGQRAVHPGLAGVNEQVPPVAHRRRAHPLQACGLGSTPCREV